MTFARSVTGLPSVPVERVAQAGIEPGPRRHGLCVGRIEIDLAVVDAASHHAEALHPGRIPVEAQRCLERRRADDLLAVGKAALGVHLDGVQHGEAAQQLEARRRLAEGHELEALVALLPVGHERVRRDIGVRRGKRDLEGTRVAPIDAEIGLHADLELIGDEGRELHAGVDRTGRGDRPLLQRLDVVTVQHDLLHRPKTKEADGDTTVWLLPLVGRPVATL